MQSIESSLFFFILCLLLLISLYQCLNPNIFVPPANIPEWMTSPGLLCHKGSKTERCQPWPCLSSSWAFFLAHFSPQNAQIARKSLWKPAISTMQQRCTWHSFILAPRTNRTFSNRTQYWKFDWIGLGSVIEHNRTHQNIVPIKHNCLKGLGRVSDGYCRFPACKQSGLDFKRIDKHLKRCHPGKTKEDNLNCPFKNPVDHCLVRTIDRHCQPCTLYCT